MSYLWWALGGIGAYLLLRKPASVVGPPTGPSTTGTLAISGLETRLLKCLQTRYGSSIAVTAQATYKATSEYPVEVTFSVKELSGVNAGLVIQSGGLYFKTVADLEKALSTCTF